MNIHEYDGNKYRPKILLASLCLNEMQWLPRLWKQHRDWPGLVKWVFIEAVDRCYAASNPEMVSSSGLSIDGTTEFLDALEQENSSLVVHIKHGLCGDPANPAQGKCEARQRYLDVANQSAKPDYVIVLDADEFYTLEDQWLITTVMQDLPDYNGYIFLRREIWHPPILADQPLFSHEVVGGFWAIPCCHWWRFRPGMHYRLDGEGNHNTPCLPDGTPMTANNGLFDLRKKPDMPEMIHLGFASNQRERLSKNKYYADRGEASDKRRMWYVASRNAWINWRPGDPLPRGARVIPYTGPVPEVFSTSVESSI